MGGISLKKGETYKIKKDKIKMGLGWDGSSFNNYDLDLSAFCVSKSGKCPSEDQFVFYGQTQNPNDSVVHSGDNLDGFGEGDDESISIKLNKVPKNIDSIYIVVTIHEADKKGQNFSQIDNSFVRVLDGKKGIFFKKENELARYNLKEKHSDFTGVVSGVIKRTKKGWDFKSIGDGFHGGLSVACEKYGVQVESPEIPEPINNTYTQNLSPVVPMAPPAPTAPQRAYESSQLRDRMLNQQYNNGRGQLQREY